MLGDNTARDGVKEAVRDYCIPFFVDNRLVAARCPVWLQSSFDILIKLFERIGLLANLDKTKTVTCVPGRIQVAWTEEEYTNQQAGNTTTSKRHWVECEVCGTSLVAGSLQSHLETQQDIFQLFVLNRDIVVARPTVVYHATKSARCHSVGGKRAPGTIYANISSCNIPRILFAFQSRAPYPYQSVIDVDCRHR